MYLILFHIVFFIFYFNGWYLIYPKETETLFTKRCKIILILLQHNIFTSYSFKYSKELNDDLFAFMRYERHW